eukprot:scpid91836/ scgid3706/ CAS1 domain-containing protein 1
MQPCPMLSLYGLLINLYHFFLCIVLSMSSSRTARTCFSNSKVLFIGDSQIRALQNRFLEYVNPYPEPEVEKPSEIPGRDLRHQNRTSIIKDAAIHVDFIWDAFIGESWTALFSYLQSNPLDSVDLIVTGAALWTIRRDPSLEGLDQYQADTESVLRLLSSIVRQSGTNLVWVQQAYINERVRTKRRSNFTNQRIRIYNDAVDGIWRRVRTPGMFKFSPGHAPLIPDGAHYTDDANDKTMQVILNTHCNSQLPVTDRKTCCQGLLHSITAPQVVLL